MNIMIPGIDQLPIAIARELMNKLMADFKIFVEPVVKEIVDGIKSVSRVLTNFDKVLPVYGDVLREILKYSADATLDLANLKDIKSKVDAVFDILDPVMRLLTDPVIIDLINCIKEAENLAERAQDSKGQPIPMKNMDPDTLIRMLALSNIPVAGGIIKGMVKTAKMAEYQERIGRGFASKLDEIDFYLSDSGLGNVIAPMLSVENVPKWFLRGKST